jgi:hypothetical protein
MGPIEGEVIETWEEPAISEPPPEPTPAVTASPAAPAKRAYYTQGVSVRLH